MSSFSWPSQSFIDSLGLEYPIIQAPMAGAGGVALAQAIQKAGGLGSFPCATLCAEDIQSGLEQLSSSSGAPLNVNFFTHTAKPYSSKDQHHWQSVLAQDYQKLGLDPHTDIPAVVRSPFSQQLCELIEQQPPKIVSFHFGLPESTLVERLKKCGCQIWSSATTVAEARWLEQHGVDAVIAQGFEAGGHRGLFLDPITDEEILSDHTGLIAHQVGTIALVPQIVDAVSVPVIAAGGIADGRGVAAAFTLGASAVQMGTAFLFSAEATITAMHRSALMHGAPEKTALTNVFSGKPARSAINNVMQSHGPMSFDVPAFPTAGNALAPLKTAAEAQDKPDYSSLWSGQSAQLTAKLVEQHHDSIQPPSAQTLLKWIADDARKRLTQSS